MEFEVTGNEVKLTVMARDIYLIANCINEALAYVDDWEFPARTTGTASAAQALHEELRRVMRELPPEDQITWYP
ncbi:hypothetical protein [Arthrobacter sp. GMC3]|uniref:hypothetical protein n=1 Tax=Arthrobacter sp. GMC3 TaxID=2058894 RepID=UPI000CE36A63|nr:hypothetical protein [Arthrobacter sp. GMC3]